MTVLIDPESGVTMSTVAFRIMESHIEENLERTLFDRVFRREQLIGMPFILLEDLDADQLNAFFEAAKKGLAQWKGQNSGEFPPWEELLERLQGDQRWLPDN